LRYTQRLLLDFGYIELFLLYVAFFNPIECGAAKGDGPSLRFGIFAIWRDIHRFDAQSRTFFAISGKNTPNRVKTAQTPKNAMKCSRNADNAKKANNSLQKTNKNKTFFGTESTSKNSRFNRLI
jgi:hypothetical protein